MESKKHESVPGEQEFIELKEGRAAVIDCPTCRKNTFIGIAQAFTSDDKAYPLGSCCCCEMDLTPLSQKEDLELMMEFRSMYWDKWVEFCVEKGLEPVVL